MITENGINFYTFDEAATRLGTKKGYLYNLVTSGKLTSRKIGLGRNRYISEHDVIAMVNAPDNKLASVPAPFPIRSQSLEAIELVNHGTAKISEDYKLMIAPLIRTVKDTDTEAFLMVVSQAVQSILNMLYSLPPDKPIQSISPHELLTMLFNSVDMPEHIKQQLINVSITTLGNIDFEHNVNTKQSIPA